MGSPASPATAIVFVTVASWPQLQEALISQCQAAAVAGTGPWHRH